MPKTSAVMAIDRDNCNLAVASWQDRLRQAMFDAVTEADIKEIVQGIVANAKKGDAKATRMLFEFVLGGNQGPRISNSNVLIQPEKPATSKTCAPRGTSAKLSVMQRRAAAGEALFHPEDRDE